MRGECKRVSGFANDEEEGSQDSAWGTPKWKQKVGYWRFWVKKSGNKLINMSETPVGECG